MAESNAVSKETSTVVGSGGTSKFKKTLKVGLWVFLLLVLIGVYLWEFERPSHSAPKEPAKAIVASGDEIKDSIRRAAEFLRIHQEDNGHFSRGALDPKPAFTALVVDALARSPEKYRTDTPFIKKAVDAILKTKQKNGSFCTPMIGLQTYCTSITIMALTSLEDPSYQKDVEDARDYLLTTQNQDEDSADLGGVGYSGPNEASGDVSANWIEAMRAAGVKKEDPRFKKAMENAEKFFNRLQNDRELNNAPAPGTAVGLDGGSFYRPGESAAGYEMVDGKKVLRSYGLMSYASLKSFLHLNLSKDDPRVTSAYKWVKNNYTLDENKNIGANGLYYYYLTMAKALYIYGEPEIKTTDGQTHRWAEEISKRLMSNQAPDGSWHNSQSSQWMENDSVLVSGFAIRTLSICHDELEREAHAKKTAEAQPDSKPAAAPAPSSGDAK
jgi:squalene-hopene/tetraprenyl-beta-curcumene cyclase